MRYLLDHQDVFQRRIGDNPVFIFLDFDGTLAPIAHSPARAAIPNETRELIRELSASAQFKVAIISGRELKDIKEKLDLKKIIYVGNHGLELEGPKIKFQVPLAEKYREILRQIKSDLSEKLSPLKGALLEDKGLSLSLHYRQVDKKHLPRLKTILQETVILYRVRNEIKIKSGKMVFEIRPALDWDKGKIVLWLLSRQRFASQGNNILPLYIGDDKTDEDAFKAIRRKGITIFVGKPKTSHAQYYLKNTNDVKVLLNLLSKIAKGEALCRNP